MCLGIPGCVVETWLENGLKMGKVDFGGVRKSVCLENTPQAKTGDYVVVHVGFSLSIVDAEEARQVFAFLDRLGEVDPDRETAPHLEAPP